MKSFSRVSFRPRSGSLGPAAAGALRLALCVLAAASCRPVPPPPADPVPAPSVFARVILVVDGETVVVEGGERVKLIGVDSPGIRRLADGEYRGEDEPWGRDSFRHLSRLLLHRKVGLQYGDSARDAEGRRLAFVVLDGELINARLLEEGYGRYAGGAAAGAFGATLARAESSARERGRGVWEGTGRFTPPRYGLVGPPDGKFHDPKAACAALFPAEDSFRVSVREARRMGLKPCPICLKRLALEDLAAD